MCYRDHRTVSRYAQMQSNESSQTLDLPQILAALGSHSLWCAHHKLGRMQVGFVEKAPFHLLVGPASRRHVSFSPCFCLASMSATRSNFVTLVQLQASDILYLLVKQYLLEIHVHNAVLFCAGGFVRC